MLVRINSARFVLLTYKMLALYSYKEAMSDHFGGDFPVKQDEHKKIRSNGMSTKNLVVHENT